MLRQFLKFYHIITIVTQIERTNRYGIVSEKYNYLLLFFKTEFISLNLCSKFFFQRRSRELEPEPVARPENRSRSKLDRLHNTGYSLPTVP